MEKNPNKSKLKMPALLRKDGGAVAGEMRQPWNGLTVVKKVLLIVLALVLATLLWGYVLLAQNPDRTKEFTGVEVKLESGSEADLLYKNLMVYGGSASYLKDVTVTVTAPLADITKLSANDITATVNFNDVHGAGVTRLNIKATTTAGAVVSVEPAYIDVDIDSITTRTLAVSGELTGELQYGYWRDSLNYSPRSVTVKGASRDIETISKAVCSIDLTELTESVDNSVVVELYDEDGNVFDQAKLIESIPAVDVQMTVYPYKNVEILYSKEGELPAGLVITEERLNISSVNIACERNVLNKLPGITADSVNIGNITKPGSYDYTLPISGIPQNAVLIDNANLRSVRLTIVVEESIETKEFKNVSITVAGKQTGFKYE